MAWNTVRLTLYPPGWHAVGHTTQRGRGQEKQTIHIAQAEREEAAQDPPLLPSEMKWWLVERGFESLEAPKHLRLLREGLELFVALEGGEVAEVVVTLPLAAEAWRRLPDWLCLIVELSQQFGLRLFSPPDLAPVEAIGLSRMIRSHPNWIAFASQFNWPEDIAFKVAVQVNGHSVPHDTQSPSRK